MFGSWCVQEEGSERVTRTAIGVADWLTKQNNYPAFATSRTEEARPPATLGYSPAKD